MTTDKEYSFVWSKRTRAHTFRAGQTEIQDGIVVLGQLREAYLLQESPGLIRLPRNHYWAMQVEGGAAMFCAAPPSSFSSDIT